MHATIIPSRISVDWPGPSGLTAKTDVVISEDDGQEELEGTNVTIQLFPSQNDEVD